MSDFDIYNPGDIFDSRDVIERLDELDALEAEMNDLKPRYRDAFADDNDYDSEEHRLIRELAEEGEQYAADWKYGETFISDDYFEDYARELASDIGAIETDSGWPNNFIDWKRAAEALQTDYAEVDVNGMTYWCR